MLNACLTIMVTHDLGMYNVMSFECRAIVADASKHIMMGYARSRQPLLS